MTSSGGVGGDNSGINSSGENTTNIQQFTMLGALSPIAEVPPTPGPVGVPGLGLFVGREAELARLDASGDDIVVQAVHGLGGIGKSSLVAQYVATNGHQFSQVVWITADSITGVEAGLARFATALEPQLAGILPSEALQERATSWLCAHSGWLVVLDNVNEPKDVSGLLAQARGGRFVITSRRSGGWQGLAAPLRLDVLDADEARDLVTVTLGEQDQALLVGMDELCEQLGYLPLALEQAAAYMAQSQISARDYIRLLNEYPSVMLQDAAEGTSAQRTIALIWAVTLGELADNPMVGRLLRVVAWFAPDAIPRSLLAGLGNEPEVLRAVGRLAAYSIVSLEGEYLAVHRLVQAVARTPDKHDPQRTEALIQQGQKEAVKLLLQALSNYPNDPDTWPELRELDPHVDAYAAHSSQDTDTLETSYMLTLAAVFLEQQCSFGRAIDYLERALRYDEEFLGHDHESTMITRNNLALNYHYNGNIAPAILLYEKNLTARERIFGPHFPSTLVARNNLAGAYSSAGDYARSILLHKENLAVYERVLGANHFSALAARNNLALAYHDSGNTALAIPLYETNIAACEHVLGAEHPNTLDSLSNLAAAYLDIGDITRSIALMEQVLASRERILGPEHPKTLLERDHLYAIRDMSY